MKGAVIMTVEATKQVTDSYSTLVQLVRPGPWDPEGDRVKTDELDADSGKPVDGVLGEKIGTYNPHHQSHTFNGWALYEGQPGAEYDYYLIESATPQTYNVFAFSERDFNAIYKALEGAPILI